MDPEIMTTTTVQTHTDTGKWVDWENHSGGGTVHPKLSRGMRHSRFKCITPTLAYVCSGVMVCAPTLI